MQEANQNHNVGLDLLKIWMVMSVVVSHFYDIEQQNVFNSIFTSYGNCAVPILVFSSFFTSSIIHFSPEKIKNRLCSIVIPHIFFSSVAAIMYLLLPPSYNIQGGGKGYIMQLLFGTTLNPPMWYFSTYVWLVMAIHVISVINRRHLWHVLAFVFMICVYFEYSELNYLLVSKLPQGMKWSIGRFVELLPVAIAGMAYAELLQYIKIRDGLYVCALSIVGLVMMKRLCIFTSIRGFYYQGIEFLVATIFMFTLFYFMPLYRLSNFHKMVIIKWANMGLAIIGLHFPVRSLLGYLGMNAERLSLMECAILYVVCMGLALIVSLLPYRPIRVIFGVR